MVQPFPLAERVDEASVGFHVLIVSFDGIVEVSLDFEENAEFWVSSIQCLVDEMVPDEDDFHVQRSRLRCETLRTGNAQSLTRLLDHQAPALECPLQSIIRKLTGQQLGSPEYNVSAIGSMQRASLYQRKICRQSSEPGLV